MSIQTNYGLLDLLLAEEDNKTCFDCGMLIILKKGKKPAHWASINNGLFLCMECSGEHRGYGVSISYIRSCSLDSWYSNIK